MEIEYLNSSNSNEWDEFALNSSSAWFRHTTSWIDYSMCCRFDSNSINKSFMVKQGKTVLAIVPLILEYSYPEKNINCFAMYGDYTPMPAYKDNSPVSQSKVQKTIQEEIKNIISDAENNIRYGKFMIDPLIEFPYFNDFASYNMLEEGASLDFQTTNIVDLRLDENEILRKMRKGHKSAIGQVLKETTYRIDIFDKSNITKDILSKFKKIHIVDAGRQTRTDESWDKMLRWIENDYAILVMLWSIERQGYISGALIMKYKKSAYYASFATLDSNFLNGHVGHLLQWNIIKHLKACGIEIYETGVNHREGEALDEDDKLAKISGYKKGFRSAELPKITYLNQYTK